jgi:hypothetical protein
VTQPLTWQQKLAADLSKFNLIMLSPFQKVLVSFAAVWDGQPLLYFN